MYKSSRTPRKNKTSWLNIVPVPSYEILASFSGGAFTYFGYFVHMSLRFIITCLPTTGNASSIMVLELGHPKQALIISYQY